MKYVVMILIYLSETPHPVTSQSSSREVPGSLAIPARFVLYLPNCIHHYSRPELSLYPISPSRFSILSPRIIR
ncbi:hypothetical protein BDN67DRAFT_975437 [Paxillus ammoniavirescens]|nr:hypothetical protein BDN67DRAFT_975437 [Paxillus ammoniavirescens]